MQVLSSGMTYHQTVEVLDLVMDLEVLDLEVLDLEVMDLEVDLEVVDLVWVLACRHCLCL